MVGTSAMRSAGRSAPRAARAAAGEGDCEGEGDGGAAGVDVGGRGVSAGKGVDGWAGDELV
jgi:hypothetical protein